MNAAAAQGVSVGRCLLLLYLVGHLHLHLLRLCCVEKNLAERHHENFLG